MADAESILQRLELPYRVMKMCTGGRRFHRGQKEDPEVWMPSYGRYVEISSCSNFEAFQARRANIRYRSSQGEAGIRPHAERLGPSRRPHAGRYFGKLPKRGRHRHRSRSIAPVHGRLERHRARVGRKSRKARQQGRRGER